jgi:hypothetical protein
VYRHPGLRRLPVAAALRRPRSRSSRPPWPISGARCRYAPALPPPDELSELPAVSTNQKRGAMDRGGRSREGAHPRG